MATRLPKRFDKHPRARLNWSVDFTGPLARRGEGTSLAGSPYP